MNSVWNADRILTGLPRPETIIDVGANQSQMTRLLQLLAAPGAEILSFEPIPALNPIGKRFYQALSDTDGKAEFFIPGVSDDELGSLHRDFADQSGQGARSIQVEMARFDTLVANGVVPWAKLKKPVLLKIDTEGNELKVLKGFGDYLRSVDYVLTEVENDNSRGRHYDLIEMCARMKEAGFDRSRMTYACFEGDSAAPYFDLFFWRHPTA